MMIKHGGVHLSIKYTRLQQVLNVVSNFIDG